MSKKNTKILIQEERIGIQFEGKPESFALKMLHNFGWYGSHSEGHTIRSILRTLILPVLIEFNPYKDIGDTSRPYSHAIHFLIHMTAGNNEKYMQAYHNYTPEYVFQLMHDSIDKSLKEQPDVLQTAYQKIATIQSRLFSVCADPLFPIERFTKAANPGIWHNLLELYIKDFGAISSGWPDLELSNGKEIILIEIKTTDYLSKNQRKTITQLINLGIPCKVLRLIRTK